MENILEVTGLCKSYPKSDFSLKNVSFSVPYGSIMGFVGENGAGKTTTIGTILGTLRKDGGDIKLFGQEMTDGSTELRENIGVVFDAANFPGGITPEQLSSVMAGVYKRWDRNSFSELLRRLQVPVGKKIKSLSRGMTMKLAIAAALSHSCRLLVLDEATSGLDPIVRDEILDVFLDFVTDERRSILLSSHITSDLERIADYITIIHNGSTILTAKKDDLIYNYGIMRCKADQLARIEREDILAQRARDYQTDVLVADKKAAERRYKGVVIDNATIDEIMILLVKGEKRK